MLQQPQSKDLETSATPHKHSSNHKQHPSNCLAGKALVVLSKVSTSVPVDTAILKTSIFPLTFEHVGAFESHIYQRKSVYVQIYQGSADRRGFQMLLCASVWALAEEREAMIIEANHSNICWTHKHYGQSVLFKNPLNSAQMLAGNGHF